MAEPALVPSLSQPGKSRILFIVADGLGGRPREAGGPTELEAAATRKFDRLASDGGLGQILARELTPLVLAHAARLRRYDA